MADKQIKKWIAENLIFIWVVVSILFAFIIHCLFSLSAKNDWWEAKWSAGDILTYVSTVSLGLLAVWQNKKFKEESDVSQQRMERVAKQANEIAMISKIISYERERNLQLQSKVKLFRSACDQENILAEIADVAAYPADFRELYVKIMLESKSKQITTCAVDLIFELETYINDESRLDLIKQVSTYTEYSKTFINQAHNGTPDDEISKKRMEAEKRFTMMIESFISNREKNLNIILYGDFTIDEIKAMYKN